MICWIYRLLRSIGSDPANRNSAGWRRHLASCPSCRQESSRAEKMGHALRQAPRPHVPPANPFLHQRIMHALQREGTPALTHRNPSVFWRLATSTLAVTALVLALTMLHHRHSQPKISSPSHPAGWGTIVPSASALARWGMQLNDPLQTEGQLVLQDARNAVTGLAHALPGDLIVSYWPSSR